MSLEVEKSLIYWLAGASRFVDCSLFGATLLYSGPFNCALRSTFYH